MKPLNSLSNLFVNLLQPIPPELKEPSRVLVITAGNLTELTISTSIIETIARTKPNVEIAIAIPEYFCPLFQYDKRITYLFPLKASLPSRPTWESSVLNTAIKFLPQWVIAVHSSAIKLVLPFWNAIKIGVFDFTKGSPFLRPQLDYLFSIEDYQTENLPKEIENHFPYFSPKLQLPLQKVRFAQQLWKNMKTPKIALIPLNIENINEWLDLYFNLYENGFNVFLVTNSENSSSTKQFSLQPQILRIVNLEMELISILSLIVNANLCMTTSNGIAAVCASYQVPTLRWNKSTKKLWRNDPTETLSIFSVTPPDFNAVLNWVTGKMLNTA